MKEYRRPNFQILYFSVCDVVLNSMNNDEGINLGDQSLWG